MTTSALDEPGHRWLKLVTRLLEVVTLGSITLFVWGLFVAIPVVIYTLSSVKSGQMDEATIEKPGECAEQTGYEGMVCTEELMEWQECFSGQQEISIASNVDQLEAENMATTLLTGLKLLSPSAECEAAIKPFMCLYLFGSCDQEGRRRQVSQRDCLRLRDELCPEQWATAARLMFELPDCSQLEDKEIQCVESDGIMNGTMSNQTSDSSEVELPSQATEITCAEGFFMDNSSSCRQLCSSWVKPMRLVPDDIVIITSLVGAVISATVVIIVALTILRSEMLTFPKYYLIYLCLSTAIVALTVLIGVVDKEKLFCGSKDLLENFQTGSPYCNINGIVYHYGVIQISLWSLFFTLGVYWGVFHPFHFQKFKSGKKFKYVHVVTFLLGIVLPLAPVLVQVRDGYHLSESPRRAICIGQSVPGIFGAFLLPFSILSAIITTLLVVIFWKILKELAIKKLSRDKKPVEVGKAQAKILSVICYHVFTSCILLVTFLFSLYTRDKSSEIIRDYLLCQSSGLQPDKRCGESPDTQLHMLNSLGTTSVFFQSLVPLVVFMFITKCRCSRTNAGSSATTSRTRSRNNYV